MNTHIYEKKKHLKDVRVELKALFFSSSISSLCVSLPHEFVTGILLNAIFSVVLIEYANFDLLCEKLCKTLIWLEWF